MPNFNYQIVQLHHVCETQKDLVNQIYEMWTETFDQVLTDAGATLDHGDFFRSHSAGVLLFRDEVIGFNLFTTFDMQLAAHRNHHYFKELDPTLFKCPAGKLRKVMTMEYFTVSPKWRRQCQEVNWGEILAGLGLNYFDNSNVHLGLGTPRVDVKVDQMCKRLGASVAGHIEKMNYTCAVVLFDKKDQRKFQDPLTHHWVSKLWNKYHDRNEKKVSPLAAVHEKAVPSLAPNFAHA
ncbi:hypothetical protein ACES2L_05560 [Bdellovibrio bacteriovorus]